MFRRIVLGSAIALMACSSKGEDSDSTVGNTESTGSSTTMPAPVAPTPEAPSGNPSVPVASSSSPTTTKPPTPSETNAGGGGGGPGVAPAQPGSNGGGPSTGGGPGAPASTPSTTEPMPSTSSEPETGGIGGADEPATPATGAADGGASAPAGSADCSRETLLAFVDTYLDALAAHDSSTLPVTDNVKYTENSHETALTEGLWAKAGEAELVRSLVDTVQCSTVTEVVLPEDGTDVVMTQRLKLEGGKLSESEAVITRDGDWLFDAQGYLDSADQKWDVLPEDQRTSREDLIAAAKAYYDEFNDNPNDDANDPIDIPFDDADCTRLEGGQGTAQCTQGIPEGVPITDRRYWADEEAGVSVSIALFASLLDAHYYRMISGKIHHVHSMSVQSETFTTTGWPGGVD